MYLYILLSAFPSFLCLLLRTTLSRNVNILFKKYTHIYTYKLTGRQACRQIPYAINTQITSIFVFKSLISSNYILWEKWSYYIQADD